MLFSSIEFIFIFLPITALFFYCLQAKNNSALSLLLIGSLIFYAYYSIIHLIIMLSSVLLNFYVGRYVYKNKAILGGCLAINLSILGYFKYYFFFTTNLNYLISTDIHSEKLPLPLGISFFTFQQIAYLIDTYRFGSPERKIVPYALLVSFFPHSIAGPLVQYKEITPQFKTAKISLENIVIGSSIFIIGLFKKIILADSLAPCANVVFGSASNGMILTISEAWVGAVCYTLQLYFDFSGYSDMAIGIAKIFNIQFPMNFNSPYKTTCIIDFWRSWHITLSNFLKNYLYLPLGGSRHGFFKKYRNLLITMCLGGLWHGANWTFIVWGGLHGLFLIINHLWRHLYIRWNLNFGNSQLYFILSWLLTINCVIIAWVFFRADNLNTAGSILKSMFGYNGISLSPKLSEIFPSIQWINDTDLFHNNLFQISDHASMIVSAIIICFTFPNVKQYFNEFYFKLDGFNLDSRKNKPSIILLYWNPSVFHAIIFAVMTSYMIFILFMTKKMEFLYFDF